MNKDRNMPNAAAGDLAPEASAPSERPKVVYTQAPLSLARLLGPTEDGRRIESHGTESVVAASSDVDPALLREVAERGGRVLLEIPAGDGPPQIAGVVQVRRTLEIDEEGNVFAKLRSLELRATQSVLLSTGARCSRSSPRTSSCTDAKSSPVRARSPRSSGA